MQQAAATTISTLELTEALHAVEPAVVLAPRRLMRRIIRMDTGVTSYLRSVPHRKTYVISQQRLLKYCDRDELELPRGQTLADEVILIVRPRQEKLNTLTPRQVLCEYWRYLFHAKLDQALKRAVEDGRITPAVAVQRIDDIGQAAFDEIRDVLRKERFLLPPADNVTTYCEFVAVMTELRHFLPLALVRYFPTINDFDRVERIVAQDVDGEALLAASRPDGCPTEPPAPLKWPDPPAETLPAAAPKSPLTTDPREAGLRYAQLMRRSDKLAAMGNMARAALVRTKAAANFATDDKTELTHTAARRAVEQLADRLIKALDIEEGDREPLIEGLVALLEPTAEGFRSPATRVLYDLQRVCIDHERNIFKLDLIEWTLTRGKVPIRRMLPNQSIVLVHKHLTRALRRLRTAKAPHAARDRLLPLLTPRLHEVEHRIRDVFGPKIEAALNEVGLKAKNTPEEVGRRKLAQELLDRIVERGFATMGDLRDAISRNSLKLPDLTTQTFLRGDQLLQLDKRLARSLDGVYRRGEIYRRWPQRLSSLAFGTNVGRFITQYLVLPYLGAYMVLSFLQHLVHGIAGDETGIHLAEPLSIALVGTLMLWLIYSDDLRRAVFRLVKWIFNKSYGIVIELPSEIMQLAIVRKIITIRLVRWAWRFLLKPGLIAGLLWVALYAWGIDGRITLAATVALFLAVNLMTNTRLGRNVEEIGGDLFARLWQRMLWRGLYNVVLFIVDISKRVLDAIERILYNVDEWLRFRTGETRISFVGKLVGGTLWFFVSYMFVFAITLLIEPQVNPIKHFPVVTVSHKLILPLGPVFAEQLTPWLGVARANTIVWITIWGIPGMFGFLAWELKENWRLYRANRPRKLKPVIIGHHGETMHRLLKPGFHSGTVPKLYAKLRKIERQRGWRDAEAAERKYLHALHHVELGVQRFMQRELANLLEHSTRFGGLPVKAGAVELGGNSVRVELRCDRFDNHAAWLSFEEQSGWLVVSVLHRGWLSELNDEQRSAFRTALSGLYKLAAVDLVREQVEQAIDVGARAYDVDDRGIVIWQAGEAEPSKVYKLDHDIPRDIGDRDRPTLLTAAWFNSVMQLNADVRGVDPTGVKGDRATPDAAPPARPHVNGDAVPMFRVHPITWRNWVRAWKRDGKGLPPAQPLFRGPDLLLAGNDSGDR